MVETLNRAKLAEIINREIGLSREDALSVVEDILNEMSLILIKERILKISSFGTFKVTKKKVRVGRNPKTRQEVLIKERNSISFSPSSIIKKFINDEEDER